MPEEQPGECRAVMQATAGLADSPEWRFWQVFGDEQAGRADEVQEGASYPKNVP